MDLFTLLEEVRVIARKGLTYTKDVFDRQRYERLLELVTQTYSDQLKVPIEGI